MIHVRLSNLFSFRYNLERPDQLVIFKVYPLQPGWPVREDVPQGLHMHLASWKANIHQYSVQEAQFCIMGRYWICLAPWMPPAKLPKPLSRFLGGFRGVGQTSSLAIVRALAPPFADIDRGTNSMTFTCNAWAIFIADLSWWYVFILMCMYSWPSRNSRSIYQRKESIPKLAELWQCTEQLQELGSIQGHGPRSLRGSGG